MHDHRLAAAAAAAEGPPPPPVWHATTDVGREAEALAARLAAVSLAEADAVLRSDMQVNISALRSLLILASAWFLPGRACRHTCMQ